MGLLSKLILLPVKGPIDGALWVTGKITEAAEAEWNDPAALRRQLTWAEGELIAGRMTEDQYDALEEDILLRLKEAG